MITDMAQEMASLVEIKRILAAIEQGQGVLCERLDALSEQAAYIRSANLRVEGEIKRKLDCLQAKELLSQFKANGHKPKRRRK